jgi:hypothetical protein
MSLESSTVMVMDMGQDEIPPGSAPTFGEPVHAHPEANPNHLVLSASESHHLAPPTELSDVAGHFALERPSLEGTLDVFPTTVPGLVHVHADVQLQPSGAMFFDADVRASWLSSVAGEDLHGASARVIRALAELAGIPHQRTVKVGFRES